ncbi:MAG: PH domain-containing protein [Myxococcales bacterium]|nr:PH domain-containing protein [Myxococcales bacterium]
MRAKTLLRAHPSVRNHLSLIVWPTLAIPVWIWCFGQYLEKWPVAVMWGVIGALLMFPIYGWFVSQLHSYMVTTNSVIARKGILSRYTNEIRIADIRAINIRQSLPQRIMSIGDVAFSSAAGDAEEVIFKGIRDPEGVKLLVQGRMEVEKDDHRDEQDD